jgi:hypothetical protein
MQSAASDASIATKFSRPLRLGKMSWIGLLICPGGLATCPTASAIDYLTVKKRTHSTKSPHDNSPPLQIATSLAEDQSRIFQIGKNGGVRTRRLFTKEALVYRLRAISNVGKRLGDGFSLFHAEGQPSRMTGREGEQLQEPAVMAIVVDSAAFDRGTDPILDFFNVEQARALTAYRGDDALRARIEELAAKSTEGELTDAERAEYEGYVQANKFIAILQAKAQKLLGDG